MPQQGSEQIDWTQDPVQDIPGSIKTGVSEKDKFNLAKDILEACAALFLVIMTLYLFGGHLVSCQASNNVQSGVSFAGSLRCKKTYLAMAMLVFCALTSYKIYDRLARHLRLDMTLGIHTEMENVWSFSSQALYGFISLVIGFYFGGKINND